MKKLAMLAALVAVAPCLAIADGTGNFAPYETVPLTATSAGGSVSFALSKSANLPDVMAHNLGSTEAYVGCLPGQANVPGTNGTVNAMPVDPGAYLLVNKGGSTTCSGITSSGTTSVTFTSGQGL